MKQVILMRTDLGMSKGKMCAQAAHAAVEVARRMSPNHPWYFEGMAKVVVKIKDLEDLMKYLDMAREKNMMYGSIVDKTLQQMTCGIIGPEDEKAIDEITGDLPLL
jgi:PTH2 family peptidyl-tRNA hydrolase